MRRASEPTWRVACVSVLCVGALFGCEQVSESDREDGAGGVVAPVELPLPDHDAGYPPSRGFISHNGKIDEDMAEEVEPTDEVEPAHCVELTYESSSARGEPSADFVFIVDTSGSMVEELPHLKRGIEDFFGSVGMARELDATITVIAAYQQLGHLCVPTFSAACAGANGPVTTATFHYDDRFVHSSNSWDLLLQSAAEPGQWYERLRGGVQTIFIEVSDDNPTLTMEAFEGSLRALDERGILYNELGERQYVWHSIIGVPTNSAGFLEADDTLEEVPCATAPQPGIPYQQLSQATGGLRFSVCEELDYNQVLETISGELEPAEPLPCDFSITPQIEDGEVLHPDNVRLRLSIDGSAARALDQVLDPSECGANTYILTTSSASKHLEIELCDPVCDDVKRAEQATLTLHAECEPIDCDAVTHTQCGE